MEPPYSPRDPRIVSRRSASRQAAACPPQQLHDGPLPKLWSGPARTHARGRTAPEVCAETCAAAGLCRLAQRRRRDGDSVSTRRSRHRRTLPRRTPPPQPQRAACVLCKRMPYMRRVCTNVLRLQLPCCCMPCLCLSGSRGGALCCAAKLRASMPRQARLRPHSVQLRLRYSCCRCDWGRPRPQQHAAVSSSSHGAGAGFPHHTTGTAATGPPTLWLRTPACGKASAAYLTASRRTASRCAAPRHRPGAAPCSRPCRRSSSRTPSTASSSPSLSKMRSLAALLRSMSWSSRSASAASLAM